MKKYSFNALWLTIEKVARILAITFVGFYIARYLGPKNFGMLNYALAWLAILGSFAGLGLDNIVLREIVHNPTKSCDIISTAIRMKLVAALITILVLIVVCVASGGDKNTELMLIACFALIFQPFNVCEIYFQAKGESKKIVQAQVIQSVISSAIKIALVYISAPLELFVLSYVLDALILAAGIFAVTAKNSDMVISLFKFDVPLAKKMVVSAFPVLLAGMATAIYMKLDLIMLENLASPEALGVYAAAAKLSESWYFLPVAICSAFTPLLLSLHNANSKIYDKKLMELYAILIWGSIVMGVFASVFGKEVIQVLYGDMYLQASEILAVHIWSGVFVCIGLVNSISLLSKDRLYQNLLRNSGGAVMNVALNLFWIPAFGPLGAAYATLVAYAFTAWVSIVFFKNGRHEFYLVARSFISPLKIFYEKLA